MIYEIKKSITMVHTTPVTENSDGARDYIVLIVMGKNKI